MGKLKLNWCPSIGDNYYVVDLLDKKLYDMFYWFGDENDYLNWEKRLICKSKTEAIKKAKKMLNSIKTNI